MDRNGTRPSRKEDWDTKEFLGFSSENKRVLSLVYVNNICWPNSELQPTKYQRHRGPDIKEQIMEKNACLELYGCSMITS